MRKLFKFPMILLPLLLAGCGTMNSHFSCNATAGDSCLTIEEVDAMTRFADDKTPRQLLKSSNSKEGYLAKVGGQPIWVTGKTKEPSWG